MLKPLKGEIIALECKYIYFRKVGDNYEVVNKRGRDVLAVLAVETQWRCWIMMPNRAKIWSADCLRDVAGFLEALNKEGAVQP